MTSVLIHNYECHVGLLIECLARIFGLNDIKLYAKNEEINLCFHWMVRYAKNWAAGKQMKMIASYNFILVDCRSQNELLTRFGNKVQFIL